MQIGYPDHDGTLISKCEIIFLGGLGDRILNSKTILNKFGSSLTYQSCQSSVIIKSN